MKLNRFERALMNNPVRAWIERHYEAPRLIRLGGRLDGLCALEIGCGRGVGAEILLERFGARAVHAFDLDPTMAALARRRLAAYLPERVQLAAADVTAIPLRDASVDAVADFGILHHVPDWQAGVAEVRRVLRPGGRFYFEEVTRRALGRWVTRKLFDHPAENRFDAREFVRELERRGIEVGANWETRGWGDFVIGVGRAA